LSRNSVAPERVSGAASTTAGSTPSVVNRQFAPTESATSASGRCSSGGQFSAYTASTPPIDVRAGIGHVVADEPDGLRDRTVTDVGRSNATAPFGQLGRDRRAVTDADFDEVVVSAQPVGERRVRIGVHVGMFISNGI